MLPIEQVPTTAPTGPDADPGLDPAMCRCGRVWLLAQVLAFHAEGDEHSRDWCRRTAGAS